MDIDLLSKMVKELILDNDKVCLPGMGCFVAEVVPSVFSDRGYTINPPYRRLSFRTNAPEDSLLADFYAKANGIESSVAEQILRDFISELKNILTVRKNVVFPGLGRHLSLQVLSVHPHIGDSHHPFKLNVQFLSFVLFRKAKMLPVHGFSLIIDAPAVDIGFLPDRVGQIYALPPLQFIHGIIRLDGFLDVASYKLPALIKIQLFPTSIVARRMGLEKRQYFELDSEEERRAPSVKF